MAGAATALVTFVVVSGYWVLRGWVDGQTMPSAETVLVRSLIAAVVGFFLGWVAYLQGAALVREVTRSGLEGPGDSGGTAEVEETGEQIERRHGG